MKIASKGRQSFRQKIDKREEMSNKHAISTMKIASKDRGSFRCKIDECEEMSYEHSISTIKLSSKLTLKGCQNCDNDHIMD